MPRTTSNWIAEGAWCFCAMLAAVFVTAGAVSAGADGQSSRPLDGVEEVVFAVRQPGKDGHWYANFGHYAADVGRKAYGQGGRLCRLNLRTGVVTTLLEDRLGGIRDPQVRYDGNKILFSYRKSESEYYHLYEINPDGSDLHELTGGPYDDIEPTYLPDGDIMFCSSRCNCWVECWLTRVAVLYRCDSNGGRIRRVSANTAHDNTPWPLPDGRILYTRWEYINRSQVDYHHLWVKNPDGTGEMTFYGNMHPGTVMIDAKPIPGSNKVVAIFSPGHGTREHDGFVTVVDPAAGPDDPSSARQVSTTPHFRDPYPLAEDCFLVARGAELLVVTGRGESRILYALPEKDRQAGLQCHEPRPLVPRQPERVLPARTELSSDTGLFILADVYRGRNMTGVKPGAIKKLLVLEPLPKPINFTGGMEPLSYGGSFILERVLGTVPVEPDGSAYFEAPALRGLVLAALDEQDCAVKRMQSFVSVMPGETASCVGCHEERTRTPANGAAGMPAALRRELSVIQLLDDVPEVFDFPRDIQPILDKHCVACHGYEATGAGGPRAGGVILTGDRGPVFSHSYFSLSARRQMADGRNLPKSNYPPRAFGSGGSPLMNKINGSHHGVQLSERERRMIRLWIDTGATYPGTYAALGTGMIGGYAENKLDRSDTAWLAVVAAREVLERRCSPCHAGKLPLPGSPSDDMEMPPWSIRYDDPRLRVSRHILYNLTHIERSLLLLAPLAGDAGGYAICRASGDDTKPVFADKADPDYRKLLDAVRETKNRLDTIRRFDMPGFHPHEAYLREMKRFGALSADTAGDALDVYSTDQAYWKGLWWQPDMSARPRGRRGMGARY